MSVALERRYICTQSALRNVPPCRWHAALLVDSATDFWRIRGQTVDEVAGRLGELAPGQCERANVG